MLLPTFSQVKNSRAVQVAAACNDSPEFMSLVNEATEILMMRGDWPGTVMPIRVSVRGGCIVWPRYVQRVRRINHCQVPIKVGTIWYDFIDKQDYVGWCGANFYAYDGSGAAYRGLAQSLHQPTMASQGRVPVVNDIPNNIAYNVRCYCMSQKDVGKVVQIFGVDYNNQRLQTLNPDSSYTDGISVVLAVPFTDSISTVARIDSIQKDITTANVPMYAVDSTKSIFVQLGNYDPSETNPSYAKDRLDLRKTGGCGNGTNDEFTVIALVKIAFIPVMVDTDYVTVPSLSAISMAIQAIKKREAGDVVGYKSFLQGAVDELNMVLETEQPIDQTPVDEGFGGGIQVGMQQVV